ncbi:MAG: Hpt domain-containing protein [Micropruina sp.]|uniref:Hpt domain-containing protein n=1 Tax=Micropruina sp. TaxID=2737536 RepID=UPI0039E546EB
MTAPDPMATAYEALAQRAWDSNRERAAELSTLVADWRATGVLTEERRERARWLGHSVRGSAGTFGHQRAADAADQLQSLLHAEDRPSLNVVAGLVEQIEQALAEPPRLEI